MKHIAGSQGPFVTGKTDTKSDKTATVVEVEGRLQDLRGANPDQFCPNGMVVENSTISPTGGGMGKLSIRCINYGSGDVSTTPTRITWRITMGEVQTDLKNHPSCVDDRTTIEKWLATDADKRYDESGDPQWVDAEGTEHPIPTGGGAAKYIKAYEKGIETYNRYFPIIEKVSFYKTLPGCSMNGNSTTSGTVSQFSSNLGKWDVPDVKLSGFANAGWFKSGDNYEQGNDLVWTRNEQWTWTPDHGQDINWIYSRSSS